MKTLCLILAGMVGLVSALKAADAASPALDPHLEPLRPWLEKTWKGEFKSSKPENPTIDIARWERALNGQAVRILHSINNGVYGGETLFTWNEKEQSIVYHYFTTAGFMTKGTIKIKDGVIHSHELVTGSANGVTEVRGETRMRPDGSFHIKTQHLKDGTWSDGRETTYREDPNAKVIFK